MPSRHIIKGIDKELVPPQAYSKIGAHELKRWAEMVGLSGAKLDRR